MATAEVAWLQARVRSVASVAGTWNPSFRDTILFKKRALKVGRAGEADTALSLLALAVLDVGLAGETDAALALAGIRTEAVSFVGTMRRGGASYEVDVMAVVTLKD